MFLGRAYRGLCGRCSYNHVCTYSKDGAQPVAACEEFDEYTMSRPVACGGNFSPLAKSWVRHDEETWSGEPGLCGTCRSRPDCGGDPEEKSTCTGYR